MDQSAKPDWAPENPKGQPGDLEPPIKDAYRYQHNRLISATPNPRASEYPKGQPGDLEPPIKDAHLYQHNRLINTTPHPKGPKGESEHRRGAGPEALPGSGQVEALAQTAPMPPHVAGDQARLREMLPVPDADEAGESPPALPPDPPQDLGEPREHGSLEPRREGE